MNLVQLAGMPTFDRFVMSCRLPRVENFCRFVAIVDGRTDRKVVSADHAKNFIHNTCNIETRTELKHNRQAQRRFDLLVSNFNRWQREQEVH